MGPCSLGNGTALALIKPHAVEEGLVGRILDDISTYFDIAALEMMAIDRTVASEFLEVYRYGGERISVLPHVPRAYYCIFTLYMYSLYI